jgi:FkbM family methyltransferase
MDVKEIKKLLKKKDPTVLEIGAQVGGDTKKFLQEFKGIRIYCFEPDPRCIKIFKKSIKDDRCALIEVAVSNIDGKTVLYLSRRSKADFNLKDIKSIHGIIRLGSELKYALQCSLFKKNSDSLGQASIKKSISRSDDYPWLIFDQKIEVETIKLDTWIKKHNISLVDFIWSDVQGAEKDMIEGAVNTLKITKYFYMEYGELSPYPEALTRNETIALLRMHNFNLIEEYSSKSKRGDLLFVNTKYI